MAYASSLLSSSPEPCAAAGASKAENDLGTRRASRRHGPTNERAGPRSPRSRQKRAVVKPAQASRKQARLGAVSSGRTQFVGRTHPRRGRSCQMLTQRPVGCADLRAAQCPLPESKDDRLFRPRQTRLFHDKCMTRPADTAVPGGRCEDNTTAKRRKTRSLRRCSYY